MNYTVSQPTTFEANQSDLFGTLRPLLNAAGEVIGKFHCLKALEEKGLGSISRLPVSLRLLLESMVRNCDGVRVTPEQVRSLCAWLPNAPRTQELPFTPSRVLLQDLNGVPLIADLAAMREVAVAGGKSASLIEPQIPVDLVVDHSVQVDHHGTPNALIQNMSREFGRNEERYRFLKWGAQAFQGIAVTEPGVGICHQVNLERLATGVMQTRGVFHPDSVVCPDSHTTMINGLGILGWGIGGIEAEAGMLGQPIFLLTPNVVGVELVGALRPGVTATDAVLSITERLRKEGVVGDFVEFLGDGAAHLPVATRATIANMAPEYGAFIGLFPTDKATLAYYEATARSSEFVGTYLQAQGLLGMPTVDQIDYTRVIRIDLSSISACVAGPRRPQDRIAVEQLPQAFSDFLVASNLSGCTSSESDGSADIQHGDLLLAAITSCTNTSNPSVMVAAGLLARNAASLGLQVPARVKTSLAPGSRAVTALLEKADLLSPLEALGFSVVAYGCTTCIGNSGPLSNDVEQFLANNTVVGCAVLSGNRNFEGRIHSGIRANFLASPPLVIAYALAGRMNVDITTHVLGRSADGKPVYLADVWPSDQEIDDVLRANLDPALYVAAYSTGSMTGSDWDRIAPPSGDVYAWAPSSYILRPPFFDGFTEEAPAQPSLEGARALAIFGNSLTTDHISPAGAIGIQSTAGRYLRSEGISPGEFNSFGARRGNHEVMVRGTFAHPRIRNLMTSGKGSEALPEGGHTFVQPGGIQHSIFTASEIYRQRGTPTFVFGGYEYGTGSARDWAAKGTRLLGVAAVIVGSFERIHRLNLVLTGVLPLEFLPGENAETLGLTGEECFDLLGVEALMPRQQVTLKITKPDGTVRAVDLLVRLDTPIEVTYFKHGGITPYVLRQILAR